MPGSAGGSGNPLEPIIGSVLSEVEPIIGNVLNKVGNVVQKSKKMITSVTDTASAVACEGIKKGLNTMNKTASN